MDALLESTLSAAVQWQCRVLDQAALFACLLPSPSSSPNAGTSTGTNYSSSAGSSTGSSTSTMNSFHPSLTAVRGTNSNGSSSSGGGGYCGLLWHIDRFEDAFLLSPRSDAVMMFR